MTNFWWGFLCGAVAAYIPGSVCVWFLFRRWPELDDGTADDTEVKP